MLPLQLVLVLVRLIDFYEWLVVIWCILSWFPIREGSIVGDIATVINRLVAPFMNIFRRFIPPLMGIDLSPIVGIVALNALQRLVMLLG